MYIKSESHHKHLKVLKSIVFSNHLSNKNLNIQDIMMTDVVSGKEDSEHRTYLDKNAHSVVAYV
jgi:hypothetical protein